MAFHERMCGPEKGRFGVNSQKTVSNVISMTRHMFPVLVDPKLG
jgi:hypothetical protein